MAGFHDWLENLSNKAAKTLCFCKVLFYQSLVGSRFFFKFRYFVVIREFYSIAGVCLCITKLKSNFEKTSEILQPYQLSMIELF